MGALSHLNATGRREVVSTRGSPPFFDSFVIAQAGAIILNAFKMTEGRNQISNPDNLLFLSKEIFPPNFTITIQQSKERFNPFGGGLKFL